MWQEAMTDLGEQVHIEHVLEPQGEDGKPPPPAPPAPEVSVVEAFQHFACLYINYMRILSR
jgi:hypothetical protein